MPEILRAYSKVYPYKIKSRSVPHIIFKPPHKTGGMLVGHNDSGTWNDMYDRCKWTQTLDEWVINYGLQTLAYKRG